MITVCIGLLVIISPNCLIFGKKEQHGMLTKIFTPFPLLTTDRLTLRQLRPADEQEIFSLRSDTDTNKYIDRPLAETIDDARKFITMINEKIGQDEAMYWAIELTGSHTFIGTACMFGFSGEEQNCEVGYELLPQYRANGFMQEAMQRVIAYGFEVIRLKTIEAVSHKDNQASIKLLEKLHFKKAIAHNKQEPDMWVFTLGNPK
jgi:[ribosomal protein S5]-alanine N-acetyltransferase